jgi:hypothetical protein
MVPYYYGTDRTLCFGVTGNADSTASMAMNLTVTVDGISFSLPAPAPKEETDIKARAKAEKISIPKLIKKQMNNHSAYKERKEYWR